MLASLFGISTLEQDVNPEYYKKLINPGNIIDGHCASCAFNTYLTLKGYDPKPALEPNGRYKILVIGFMKDLFLICLNLSESF